MTTAIINPNLLAVLLVSPSVAVFTWMVIDWYKRRRKNQ